MKPQLVLWILPNETGNLALVELLRAVGGRYGYPPGQAAIAWALRNPVGLSDKEIAKIEGRNINEPESVTAV